MTTTTQKVPWIECKLATCRRDHTDRQSHTGEFSCFFLFSFFLNSRKEKEKKKKKKKNFKCSLGLAKIGWRNCRAISFFYILWKEPLCLLPFFLIPVSRQTFYSYRCQGKENPRSFSLQPIHTHIYYSWTVGSRVEWMRCNKKRCCGYIIRHGIDRWIPYRRHKRRSWGLSSLRGKCQQTPVTFSYKHSSTHKHL